MYKRMMTSVLMLTVGLGSSCFYGGEAVVGEWVASSDVGGYRNNLMINEDLTGHGDVYFVLSGADGIYVDSFSVEVVVNYDNTYMLQMYCDFDDSDCQDFTLECRASNYYYMSCTGNGLYENYQFPTFAKRVD